GDADHRRPACAGRAGCGGKRSTRWRGPYRCLAGHDPAQPTWPQRWYAHWQRRPAAEELKVETPRRGGSSKKGAEPIANSAQSLRVKGGRDYGGRARRAYPEPVEGYAVIFKVPPSGFLRQLKGSRNDNLPLSISDFGWGGLRP